jgi:HEAT repeat protein
MKTASLCLLLAASASMKWGGILPQENTPINQNKPYTGLTLLMKHDQSGENKAAILVRKLQSDHEGERAQAKKGLRSLARASAQSREEVIGELVKLIGGSEPVLRVTSAPHYDAWSFAATLLGQVKAVEALDVLIACIDCNDGIHGLSSDRFPAYKAVIMIGSDAVPKLIKTLSDRGASTRGRAALALGEIGGTDAKNALEDALISERDEDVVRSIKIALRKQ